MQQFRAFVKKIDSHLNIEGDTILSDRLKKAFAGDLNNYDQLLVIEVGSDEQGIFLTDRLKEKFKLETFFMMDEFPRSICLKAITSENDEKTKHTYTNTPAGRPHEEHSGVQQESIQNRGFLL